MTRRMPRRLHRRWSGRAQVLVEAKLVNWTSQERFAECQGMARFRKLDDGGFKRMTEQEARGILGGHWADRCITPPSISLYDGQSSWVAVTTGMPANCENTVRFVTRLAGHCCIRQAYKRRK